MNLFVLIQTTVYLNSLSIKSPAQIEMLTAEFKKLIEFESLNMVKLIQLVDPDFSIKNLVTNIREQIVNEDQKQLDFFEGFVMEALVIVLTIFIGFLVKIVIKS